MWSIIKYAVYFFVGIFFLAFVAPLLMLIFVSPEFYKAPLVNMLEKSTGREVSVQGALHWTMHPGLGISADNVSVGNPAAFAGNTDNTPFLFVRHIEMDILPGPLMHGRVTIGAVTLDGVKLYLIKNTLGQVNWTQLSHQQLPLETQEEPLEITPEKISVSSSSTASDKQYGFLTISPLAFSDISLKNSQIIYDDQQNKKIFKIINLDMGKQTAPLSAENQRLRMPVQASFDLSIPQTASLIHVNLKAIMTADAAHIRLDNINAMTDQYHWTGFLQDNLDQNNITALSGQLAVSGSHGVFKGIDLYYYSDLADALINKTQTSTKDTHETPFDSLQAVLYIQNGIVNTQAFIIRVPKMDISGKGTIDLTNQNIDYDLSLQRLTQGKEIKPRGPAIPLRVTGNISRAVIKPDWQSFLAAQLGIQLEQRGKQIGQKIDAAIQSGLQALLGN